MAEDYGVLIPALDKPAALLPIAQHKRSLLYLFETSQVTIVVAATGSGKTTQIPQFLDQVGWCEKGQMVAVTQVGESSSQGCFRAQTDTGVAAKDRCHDGGISGGE